MSKKSSTGKQDESSSHEKEEQLTAEEAARLIGTCCPTVRPLLDPMRRNS